MPNTTASNEWHFYANRAALAASRSHAECAAEQLHPRPHIAKSYSCGVFAAVEPMAIVAYGKYPSGVGDNKLKGYSGVSCARAPDSTYLPTRSAKVHA